MSIVSVLNGRGFVDTTKIDAIFKDEDRPFSNTDTIYYSINIRRANVEARMRLEYQENEKVRNIDYEDIVKAMKKNC